MCTHTCMDVGGSVCMCVCVRVRDRERERAKKKEWERKMGRGERGWDSVKIYSVLHYSFG